MLRIQLLVQFGAVSRETVQEMARGVRNALGEKIQPEKIIGISISGIAGPGGGSPEKPVGTVWIGVSGADGEEAVKFHFQGDRGEVKTQSAEKAMELLVEYLQQHVKELLKELFLFQPSLLLSASIMLSSSFLKSGCGSLKGSPAANLLGCQKPVALAGSYSSAVCSPNVSLIF